MKRIQKGFTLIELMIVVAIIGILAAVAIPAYQDYVVKAKLSKVISSMDPIKTAIAMYYQEQGDFPHDPGAATTATVATGNPGATGGTATVWSSIGLQNINIPPEVALVTYTSSTTGDNYGLSMVFAKIKAGSIDGRAVMLTPGSVTGAAVADTGTITLGASGVGAGSTTLATNYVCTATTLDMIARKFFNNAGNPCQ